MLQREGGKRIKESKRKLSGNDRMKGKCSFVHVNVPAKIKVKRFSFRFLEKAGSVGQFHAYH